MVNLILLFLLAFGLFTGIKRGFIMQVMHLAGFIIAFVFAIMYYDDLAPKLEMWIPYPEISNETMWAIFLNSLPLESAYYNGIAFVILFFASKVLLQLVANMLDFIAELPILHSINTILGAILGFLEAYLILFVLLYFLALVPVGAVQDLISSSGIAQMIIEHTPFLSGHLEKLWFEHIVDTLSNFS
ncbi:CvpA family protein [Salirhabdus salicampi]|uniref:CvpA family protein n=1 Tax=Salirhabdus salicampi TaxID=476102 RepID=UPI0020C58980|nr:CvpA family protein [Salirhabdus salicampi]MCP8617061.1 CvpA family protein [Salirhabdus salicampi]